MIKTDEVIYRIRTQEEYDWLMQELEKAGCRWMDGTKPSKLAIFYIHISNTYIYIKDKKLSYGGYDHYRLYHNSEECIEVSDIMKKPLKTDKVIYRTNTQEEYDWLMEQLEEADCEWLGGGSPICGKEICNSTKSNSYICVENETISFFDEDYLYDYLDNLDYEVIEVSDLMKNEKKTEILDKLETMNEYLNNRLKKLKLEEDDDDEESQKIKKIVYTTEVYFE